MEVKGLTGQRLRRIALAARERPDPMHSSLARRQNEESVQWQMASFPPSPAAHALGWLHAISPQLMCTSLGHILLTPCK